MMSNRNLIGGQTIDEFMNTLADLIAQRIQLPTPAIPSQLQGLVPTQVIPDFFYVTYPADGTEVQVGPGITQFDFIEGKVYLPDGTMKYLSDNLGHHKDQFMRAFQIDVDQAVVIWLDNSGKKPVDYLDIHGENYVQFQNLYVQTDVTTNFDIWASNNPDAYLRKLKPIVYQTTVNQYGQLLTNELAARLGSPVFFDGRGNVMLIDSFENDNIKGKTSTFGTGAAVTLDKTIPHTGNQALKLTAGLYAGGNPGFARLYKYSYFPLLKSRIGLEVSFTMNNNLDYFLMELSCGDGITGTYGDIWYYPALKKWQYTNNAGVLADLLTNVTLDSSNNIYNTIKLVMDLTTNKFVRLLLNNQFVDMSTYAMPTYPSSAIPLIQMQFFISSKDPINNQSIYIDDVILTQNEPL